MYSVILTVHVIIAILVVLVVLVQAGRSGGLSGLMGGGGGDALFSTSSQQSGLRQATVVLAMLFMATSIGLTILSSRRRNQSVFNRPLPQLPPVSAPAPKQQPAPAQAPTQNLPVPDSEPGK